MIQNYKFYFGGMGKSCGNTLKGETSVWKDFIAIVTFELCLAGFCFFFLIYLFFNCKINALQKCVGFCQTRWALLFE